MRIFKPQYLTPLVSVFDDGRRLHCVLTVLIHASFSGELVKDQELWFYANQETEGMVVDEAMPKTRGEYLVHGSCYSRKPDVRQSFVKVTMGEQEKVLAVFGRRTYDPAGLSQPEPFDVVPIQFKNAFGGGTFEENPAGTGYGGGVPPQVEVRGKLVTGPFDRPPVAGFGRLDPTWPQRVKRMGTYDPRWFKTRYPGVAEDFDGSYFQLSLPDQWRDDFFEGNEAFSAVNMHPERELLEGKLPGIIGRAFVKRKGEEMVHVPMRIDTVHLYPHRERQVVVCRGTTSTKSDTLSDIEEAAFALEWIGRPKPDAHYIEELANRRKRGGGARAKLDETGLLPEGNPAPAPKERLIAPGEALKQSRVERKVRHNIETVRRTMVEQGLDTTELDKFPTHIDTSVDPDSIPDREWPPPTIEDIKAKIAGKTEEVLAKIRDQVKGLEGEEGTKTLAKVDEVADKLRKGPVGPPAFSRDKTREQLQHQVTLLKNAGVDPTPIQAQLDDPKMDQQMRDLHAFVRESYRKHVQNQGPAPALEGGASEPIRAMVLAKIKNAESFAGVDLTGADLSGLDLRGAKMTRAFMESVNLTGANLEGAELDFAVLARAKLAGVNLSKCAKLTGANLSDSNLARADFSGLDLTGCFFVAADLTGTKFPNTVLDRVDFGKATLRETDMSGSTAKRPKFHKMRLEKVSIRGANWERPLFYESEVIGLDARGATLPNLSFVDTLVEGCIFDDAHLLKMRAARALAKTTMPKCSFARATIHKGMFRGIEMPGCDFHHADLKQADFSEATLDDSNFQDVRAVGARFMTASIRRCKFDRADLFEGLLANAFMEQASFESANLFRADFGRSQGEGVKMGGANVKWVRTVPKREEPST